MKLRRFLIISIGMLAVIATGQNLQFGLPDHIRSELGKPIDDIALIVNDEAISRKTLQAEIHAERAYLPPDLLKSDAIEQQLLDRIIVNHILKQVQKRLNIQITDQELNAALNSIAQKNHLTKSALFAQVKKTTGMSSTAYQEQVRRQMLEDRLKQVMLGGNIHITEAQVNDQIAQISRQKGSILHIQDMLIPLPKGTPEERAGKIDTLMATVANQLRREGQDLQAVAAHIPEARFRDFGTVNLKEIPPQFANVLANTNAGEVAENPVIDDGGMHFLKVVNKEGTGGYQIEEEKVSHILLKTGDGRDDKTQKMRAEAIYQQLLSGTDFATLARKYSEDSQSAARGGDLGWVSPEEMVSEFAKAMQTQQVGSIYPPIKTQYGYHLVIIYDRKSSDKSEELLRKRIRNSLYARAVEDAWEQQLRALREESYVDIRY